MNKLFLYNTLTRKKEEFKPIKKDEVGLYTCGPTVYNYAHIGNLRSYVFADLLVRVLKYNYGEKNVKWVMNITDVDDKTIRDAKNKYPDLPSMEALRKSTAEFEEYFWQDLLKLNILKPNSITHATDIVYVKKMRELVKNIFSSGYAYVRDGSVYFDVVKYSQKHKYGVLVDIDVSKLKSGERVDDDEYEKENVQDFVLWKGQKEDEPSWEFELDGQKLPGRPGWHIECSAMGQAELGMPFDIHTGGVDLKFPHHENEIHQSVIGYKVKQPVNYWLHNEYLLVDGKKMGKRFNNFYTLKDLEKRNINSLAFRFLCLQTGYGKVMNFTWEALEGAKNGLEHLQNQVRELVEKLGEVNNEFKNKFLSAIGDDFNTPQALAVVQEVFKSDILKEDKLATVLDFDKVLGLNLEEKILSPSPSPAPLNAELYIEGDIPKNVIELAEKRDNARAKKDWQESDKIRQEIESQGYVVKDTTKRQRIYKK